MRIKSAIVYLLGGLTLVALAGPASAQPVTFEVDLFYEKIVDGPRPRKVVRVSLQLPSAQAAEVMCRSSLLKLGRNALANPGALGLTGNWMAGGGECVADENGNIKLTVETSPAGSN